MWILYKFNITNTILSYKIWDGLRQNCKICLFLRSMVPCSVDWLLSNSKFFGIQLTIGHFPIKKYAEPAQFEKKLIINNTISDDQSFKRLDF